MCEVESEDEDEGLHPFQSSYKLTRTDTVLQQAKFKISDVAVQVGAGLGWGSAGGCRAGMQFSVV